MTRPRPLSAGSALVGFAIGSVVTLLATVAIVPTARTVATGSTTGTTVAGGEELSPGLSTGVTAPGGGSGLTTPGGGRRTSQEAQSGSGGDRPAGSCRGGSTDVGVTDKEIKLGAVVAESGPARSFLGEVRQGMDAVKNKVNRSGGICGRQLKIVYKDDGWIADRGKANLENLISGDKVFAIAVGPSSEGVNAASKAGLFRKTGVPVVGSDGMIKTQYSDPFIWPVATATTTTLHVMMHDAWTRGARSPAIVFENTYRFGVEGAYAFNQAFKRLSGGDIPGYQNPDAPGGGGCKSGSRFCGIPGGQGQYGGAVDTLNRACGNQCDYLVLLLEPKTAQDWMAVPGVRIPANFKHGIGAAQPLFTYDFGHNCADKCAGLRVWTGYNPPIEQYAGSPAVRTYVDDLASVSAKADPYNQFTQGGYLGMLLLVEALKKAGGNLTRAGLKSVLDSTRLDTGLSQPLSFAPGRHYANGAAQAFEFQSKNGFSGWRFVQPYIADPWLGQDAD